MVAQRRTCRCADKPWTVADCDDDRAGAISICRQVAFFIGFVAVIKIRPIAEDSDPQPRNVIKRAVQGLPGQNLDAQAHDTWRTQSAKL